MEKWYGVLGLVLVLSLFFGVKGEPQVPSELLGFDDYIPPYSTTSGRQILGEVNYASAAARIREETGQKLGLEF
ncbi:hypothetical protein PVK06_000563 [Gossypium arboreum]|uniref:Uncharacterized protein n=1 Tax=Gossypium arboreum TaxID=29729 RepID=A0ABR0QYW9_GOSAR|nr:hypothetical protein PVK06_000563 [Gossypium arboreum]